MFDIYDLLVFLKVEDSQDLWSMPMSIDAIYYNNMEIDGGW